MFSTPETREMSVLADRSARGEAADSRTGVATRNSGSRSPPVPSTCRMTRHMPCMSRRRKRTPSQARVAILDIGAVAPAAVEADHVAVIIGANAPSIAADDAQTSLASKWPPEQTKPVSIWHVGSQEWYSSRRRRATDGRTTPLAECLCMRRQTSALLHQKRLEPPGSLTCLLTLQDAIHGRKVHTVNMYHLYWLTGQLA